MTEMGRRAAQGDMLKSVYDTDKNDIVDDSHKLEAATKTQVQDHPPRVHGHDQEDVTDLVTDLAAKAHLVHGHAQAHVTDLVSDLAAKSAVGHAHEEADISDLDHDSQKIKGVVIDDSAKADQKVLAYDLASQNIVYIPRCPEILIKAIQHVTITIPIGDTSAQTLINEVDLDNTFLIFAGFRSDGGGPEHALARTELIDSTHVRAIRAASGAPTDLNVCVIECTAGIKSLQRGTITLDAVLYNDATINEVDTDKTFASYLCVETNQSLLDRAGVRIYLLNSTTVRADRLDTAGIVTISYEVVEFL